MKRSMMLMMSVATVVGLVAAAAQAAVFNGAPDNQRNDKGYYYGISGGLFPTGTTPNGDNASGGTYRFLTDDPSWGAYTLGVWHKDDWYTQDSGLAITLKNNASIVYDNNGLETGSFPTNFYTYNAGTFPTQGAGAVTAYSMSNNYDWIYAGYMKITAPTTVTSLTGYFAHNTNPTDSLTGGFNPADPDVRFHMNIFSNVSGDLLPTNTGSFAGDVFASDSTAGTFAFSDTGYDRTGSSSVQDIYRLTYTPNFPITLAPGEYWFSHDASIVPEPGTLVLLAVGGLTGLAATWIRRRRAKG